MAVGAQPANAPSTAAQLNEMLDEFRLVGWLLFRRTFSSTNSIPTQLGNGCALGCRLLSFRFSFRLATSRLVLKRM